MMHIAIVDDNELQRDLMFQILQNAYPCEDIDCYKCIYDYDQSNKFYDLLLLDVELPNENGIEYNHRHLRKQTYVMFVSSHAESMVDAFDINVIGFITKDKLKVQLLEKVEFAKQKLSSNKVVTLKTIKGSIHIDEQHILYVYIEESIVYAQFDTTQEPIQLTAKSLSIILNELSDYFYLINRNYIVNLKKVTHINVQNHSLSILNTLELPVSKRLWTSVKHNYHLVKYAND